MAMSIEIIEEISHLAVGDHTGWQARFADASGISRAHLSNVLNGTRSITDDLEIRMVNACSRQAIELRDRAQKLEHFVAAITMTPPHAPPILPFSREQYEADADEAEAIITEMANEK